MKALIEFLRNPVIIQAIGVCALCLLVWFAGPLVAIAGHVPFEPAVNRLLAILVIVVVWALVIAIRQMRANRKDRELIRDLAAAAPDREQQAVATAQDEERAALGKKFEESLRLLKETRAKGRRDKQYLYELPWYVIIGAPGSGKTTLLLNSGLRFPLSERMGLSPVQGVGGTRNCDWLFTEDAIFLDTAGRYATQDSHKAVDEAGWKGFLELVKKYRPRRPINGVLVTMSVDDFLRWKEDEIQRYAKALRQRIIELYSLLGVQFPVYMLFTKCDLLAGFTDFFGDLREEQRQEVWGTTFQEARPERTEEQISRFALDFDELLRRLQARTLRRLQEEGDLQRRGLILNFPRQFALLRTGLLGFLGQAFGRSGYEPELLLRGVYLTSGTQEGTPIDRVMGILAASYGLDRQSAPLFSGRGRSYFITRLLREVLFPEAELAGFDPVVERRHRLLRMAGYGAVVGVVGVMLALWVVSFVRNQAVIADFTREITLLEQPAAAAAASNIEIKALVERLNALQAAKKVYADRSVWMRFGLFQGDKLSAGADEVYEQLIKKRLFPAIIRDLEQGLSMRVQEGPRTNYEGLYNLLKVYLMMGMPEKMDLATARDWTRANWESRYAREPQLQAQLVEHSENLFKSSFEPAALNQGLITQARQILNATPLSVQIYTQLKSETFPDHSLDFCLGDALGPYGSTVFSTTAAGGDMKALLVPGLYTARGYDTYFRKKGLDYIRQALEHNWILDNPAASRASDLERLFDDLQKLYFNDYRSRWQGLLDSLVFKKPASINQTVEIIDRLGAAESPLRLLLTALDKNTGLATPPAAEQLLQGEAQKKLAEKTQQFLAPAGAATQELPRELQRHFEPLTRLVHPVGEVPPPLDKVVVSLNQVRDVLMQISTAAKSDEQAFQIAKSRMGAAGGADPINAANNEFRLLPEPVRGWLLSLSSLGWDLTLGGAKKEMNTAWKSEVFTAYAKGLQGRYPLVKNAAIDATMLDFCKFFAPNGIMDQFFKARLSTFVDTSGQTWKLVGKDNAGVEMSGEALDQFRKAAAIRDALFAAGGSSPSVSFELKPVSMDENVGTFRLNLEGQTTSYSNGPARPEKFVWPGPETNAGVRLTFITLDGKQFSASEEGPWAWMKTLDKAAMENTTLPDRFLVTFQAQGHKARYELRANSVNNPFRLPELESFRCPESL
jgi:type VI secretion system protein ImpL